MTERPTDLLPGWVHPSWSSEFPWLVQGTTSRGSGPVPFDFGLFSDASSSRAVQESWTVLRTASGIPRAVHARQLHGTDIHIQEAGMPGLQLCGPADGHVTTAAGVLLTVAVADCVPVFLVAPGGRAIGALHAGWRGAAAGMLDEGIQAMTRLGAVPDDLRVHLGPSICGACYEVGPEVFDALGEDVPSVPTPIDLRAVLARRAMARGVMPERVTISSHCTRCTESQLFSHRGGDRERQVGYIGIRC